MFSKRPDKKDTSVSEPKRPVQVTEPASPAQTFMAKPANLKGSGKMAPSIIGEDLTVTGNVISKGEIQIEGEIQGDIHCGSLVIGDKARITGGVVADDIVVRGRVNGSIRGLRVTLQSSSHVEGDIHHQSLAIEQGAYFEGKSRRTDDPQSTGKGETGSSKSSASGRDTAADKQTTRAAE